MKNAILSVLLLIAAGAAIFYILNRPLSNEEEIPNNILPVQTPASATYSNATADMIVVDAPQPGALVGRSIALSGKARGNWYFEASFPLIIQDPDGTVLFQGPIQANGEWMTTDFVPFSTTIIVPGTYTGPAMLVVQKDNPSGDPERDASVSIPITIR